LELDVMIAMDGGPSPRGPIEGRRRQRQQRRLFHGLEHDAGDLARGAVHARAGQIPTPPDGAGLHVGHIVEGLPAEKILADVGDPRSTRFPAAAAGRRTGTARLEKVGGL
jgi:hypothetical protein